MTCLQAHICVQPYVPICLQHIRRENRLCDNARHINRRRDLNKKRFSSKKYNGLRIINNWSYIAYLASVAAIYYLWTTGMMVLPACVFINCRASSHCAERSPIHNIPIPILYHIIIWGLLSTIAPRCRGSWFVRIKI